MKSRVPGCVIGSETLDYVCVRLRDDMNIGYDDYEENNCDNSENNKPSHKIHLPFSVFFFADQLYAADFNGADEGALVDSYAVIA